jgi:hypothetical protein
MSEAHYGEKYEKLIIVIMSTVILLSLIGVVSMIRHYTPDCKASYMTYCGDENNHSETPH